MRIDRLALREALERATARVAAEPIATDALAVESLPVGGSVFAAADADGTCCVAIATRSARVRPPALRLETLGAEYGVKYQLRLATSTDDVRVSVVRCYSTDHNVKGLFATFFSAVLESLSDAPDDQELAREIDRWVALFWRLETPARAEIVGLVGELTVLEMAKDTAQWVRGWHTSPRDNVDFGLSSPPMEIEVKATVSQERVHELSIHQAQGRVGAPRYFASVRVELRETGTPIGQVAEEIADRLAGMDELRMFWKALVDVSGSSFGAFMGQRYIRDVSRRTLLFYRAEDVPQPDVAMPLPAGVSRLRFSSDFSSTTPVETGALLGTR